MNISIDLTQWALIWGLRRDDFIMKLINLLIRELDNRSLGSDFRVWRHAEICQFDRFSLEINFKRARSCNYGIPRLVQVKMKMLYHWEKTHARVITFLMAYWTLSLIPQTCIDIHHWENRTCCLVLHLVTWCANFKIVFCWPAENFCLLLRWLLCCCSGDWTIVAYCRLQKRKEKTKNRLRNFSFSNIKGKT